MRTRDSITLLGSAAATWPLAARAQQSKKIPRLCFLTFDPGTLQATRFAFFEGLRDLGYVDGQSINIDYLSAEGRGERFPALAAECVRRQTDVIAVSTTPAARAAKNATRTIPIIMIALGDPVGTGLVDSLAQPGRNVTGMSQMVPEVAAKREGGRAWNLAGARADVPRRPNRAFTGEGTEGRGSFAGGDAANPRRPHRR